MSLLKRKKSGLLKQLKSKKAKETCVECSKSVKEDERAIQCELREACFTVPVSVLMTTYNALILQQKRYMGTSLFCIYCNKSDVN